MSWRTAGTALASLGAGAALGCWLVWSGKLEKLGQWGKLDKARRKKKGQGDRELQKFVVGAIGGLGPKATAVWYDENVIRGRVLLFEAMKKASEKVEERGEGGFLSHVSKVSSANWSEEELKRVWNSRIGKEKLRDQDHISLLIYTNPTIPGRPEYMSGQSKVDPTPAMADTALALVDAGADALCMVCSTAHYFKDGMLKDVSVPFYDMLDVTFEYIMRCIPRNENGRIKVGLLGTEPLLKYQVYEKACQKNPKANIIDILTPLTVKDGNQDNFTLAIFGKYGIKAGFDSDLNCSKTFENFNLLLSELTKLVNAGAQAIVLGCTELPLLLTDETLQEHSSLGPLLLVNPAQVLADQVIRESLIHR